MLTVIGGGLALLGVFVSFGWLWGVNAAGVALGATVFVPVWLLVAVVNMWVGASRAGYSAREELLILLIVFLAPAVAAIAVWRFSHT
ncbi:hypothetical protein D3C71_2096240 [compost metagenome]